MSELSTINFYRDLPGFRNFAGVVDVANYQKAPSDWKVIITDVQGSTVAIEEGRYKDVNLIGAASISTAHRALGNVEFPFVFGGDGASLLAPPELWPSLKDELTGLKFLSESRFGLKLRVGMVSVLDLEEEGFEIEVAKYVLVKNKSVAFFRGGGLEAAEKKIKGHPEKYNLSAESRPSQTLQGLSCRWQPIKNKRGTVLSMLICARGKSREKVYAHVLENLTRLLGGDLGAANPVNQDNMHYNSLGASLKDESRYFLKRLTDKYLLRLVEIFYSVMVFKYKMPGIIFNPRSYQNAIPAHSDYRKFDENLRMVLDCSREQVDTIRMFLEDLYKQKKLFYGLFESDTSLMTCFVNSSRDGNHIHFIDGGDGGYAMAAKPMKEQMKRADNLI